MGISVTSLTSERQCNGHDSKIVLSQGAYDAGGGNMSEDHKVLKLSE